MMERRLRWQLNKAARRVRHQRLLLAWAAVWLGASLAGAAIAGLHHAAGWYWPDTAWLLTAAALAAAGGSAWWALGSAGNDRRVAQRVEAVYPELRACLLTAVEQRPALADGRFGFLQDRVIQQALDHAYRHPWARAVPGSRLLLGHVVHLGALASWLAVTLGLLPQAPTPSAPQAEMAIVAAPAGGPYEVTIEPGDTEVELGASLLVLARFHGPLPPEVSLLCQRGDGATERALMPRSLEDPVFGSRIPDVQSPLTYRVAYAGQQTRPYRVGVFVYPELERADARLSFPAYTQLEDKLVQDVRRLSAVEGTRVTLLCHLNKPVAEARLVDAEGNAVELTAVPEKPAVYSAQVTLATSRRFQLRLADERGRANRRPAEFTFTAVPNKPPDLKLLQPARDVEVSPLEELSLRATARDDFGLIRFGLTYTPPDGSPREILLGDSTPPRRAADIQHVLALENLRVQPDELVSYHFWAEDWAADGHPRRTSSDMYFAEVRPFDEVFRQGPSPPGGDSPPQSENQPSGDQSPSQQLAELQKQIVNGTWKLIRRESSGKPSQAFAGDARLLQESQAGALEQAGSMAQEAEEPQALQTLQQVHKHMAEALRHLTQARGTASAAPLQPALASEQAAYQALLKLRAREHQVVRSRSNRSAASRSSPRAQQQLQQLQLQNDRERYETERLARSQQEGQDRETRQVLNRLSELAQRQQDLSGRLKELQSALQEAENEEQRQELRRQLKRLREQQEQLLRDTDELLSRMDEPQNQPRMAEARQDAEKARENVRQASEALEQSLLSRAVTAGTRAQRELEQIRDEFRRQTSRRFAEQARELRDAAAELDARQQDLSRRLEELGAPPADSPSLRDTGRREQVEEGFSRQQERLDDLLQRVRQTVLQAEEAEPLLAEQLYDVYRQAEQQPPGRPLEAARRSLQRGLLQDAAQQEQIGRQGIRRLREGVERAAESVLGDETEALRRAQQTVRELAQQLQEEAARAAPQKSPPGENQLADKPGTTSDRRPGNVQDRPAPAGALRSETEGPQQPDPHREATSAPGPRQSQEQPSRQASKADVQGAPPEAAQGEPRAPAGRPQERLGGPRPAAAPQGLGGFQRLLDEAASGPARPYSPLTGGDFRDWSDRLRDVEEMVADRELRAEAARIRERARSMRAELRRHSAPPNWDLVRLQLTTPLVQLRNRLAEELLKRTAREAAVPIDRDPVPPRYVEPVRRYYQQLGSGR